MDPRRGAPGEGLASYTGVRPNARRLYSRGRARARGRLPRSPGIPRRESARAISPPPTLVSDLTRTASHNQCARTTVDVRCRRVKVDAPGARTRPCAMRPKHPPISAAELHSGQVRGKRTGSSRWPQKCSLSEISEDADMRAQPTVLPWGIGKRRSRPSDRVWHMKASPSRDGSRGIRVPAGDLQPCDRFLAGAWRSLPFPPIGPTHSLPQSRHRSRRFPASPPVFRQPASS